MQCSHNVLYENVKTYSKFMWCQTNWKNVPLAGKIHVNVPCDDNTKENVNFGTRLTDFDFMCAET